MIDDEGVQRMDWFGPMELLETVTESVELMNFSMIQERVMQELPNLYGHGRNKTALPRKRCAYYAA